MKQKLKSEIKSILKKFGYFTSESEKKLLQLEEEFKSIKVNSNGKKILFTHSFSIYEPSYIHDKLMAFALSLRGFEIVATYCDGIQTTECNVYGGVWGDGDNFQNNCKRCQKKSKELWSFLNKDSIYQYSKYLTLEDYKNVDDVLSSILYDKWQNYSVDEMQIGLWAKDILVNNYVVADYMLLENHELLGRSHLKNLLLCKIASERIIYEINPDRIISNDSYYGMWKMWEILAKRNNIPFYSHWSGTRVGGWTYASDDAAMNLNFSKSWKAFSEIDLKIDEKKRVEKWLEDRMSGKEMIIDTASMSSFKNEAFNLEDIDFEKPTALLSANVVWDLAALNKEVFTKRMSDWIIETMRWFEKNPEYQLIIKSHPAEFFPGIPETKETVILMIQKNFTYIPKNVFILSAKVAISVYQLFPLSKVGLVFTTSIGMEMAARGIPVISAGKSHYVGYGFTFDPSSTEEYFTILKDILDGSKGFDKEKTMDLAMKFIKFNFFHYFSKTGLIEFSVGENKNNQTNIKIETIEELKKGHKLQFDYFVDCIENGEVVLSKNKWMKES